MAVLAPLLSGLEGGKSRFPLSAVPFDPILFLLLYERFFPSPVRPDRFWHVFTRPRRPRLVLLLCRNERAMRPRFNYRNGTGELQPPRSCSSNVWVLPG